MRLCRAASGRRRWNALWGSAGGNFTEGCWGEDYRREQKWRKATIVRLERILYFDSVWRALGEQTALWMREVLVPPNQSVCRTCSDSPRQSHQGAILRATTTVPDSQLISRTSLSTSKNHHNLRAPPLTHSSVSLVQEIMYART